MPNQRKPGKTNKNIWLTQQERAVLKNIKSSLGLKTDTEVIKRALEELAKMKGIEWTK